MFRLITAIAERRYTLTFYAWADDMGAQSG